MIKHLSKISGVAAFAVVASTASAETALNDYLSIDGYAIGSAVVTEGTAAKNDQYLNSANFYDSAKLGVIGKYEAFTAKVSGYLINGNKNGTAEDFGLLDAYVTYTKNEFSVTGGKYLGWLGYESFDSPNNAFISFSSATYASPYATGAKVEYIVKDYSAGVSVRDSQFGNSVGSTVLNDNVKADSFFEGDGSFSNDLGYEAYFLYTAIEKVKVFVGAGYQEIDGYNGSSSDSRYTYDTWVSYALTDKLTLVGEVAAIQEVVDYSWNALANYAFTSEFSAAVRVTGSEAYQTGNDTFGYGVASTYTLHKNFALKAEITKTENNAFVLANGNSNDVFSYAVQGVLRF